MPQKPDGKMSAELFRQSNTVQPSSKAVLQRTLSVCLPKIFPRGILKDCRDKGGGVIFKDPLPIYFIFCTAFFNESLRLHQYRFVQK